MATISKLVHVFTALAGAPEPANAYRARQLREAGLIPTFGRGRYGAEMTPAAAANLIVGVLAAETDAHSYVDAVRRLSEPHALAATQCHPGLPWVSVEVASLGYHFPGLALTALPDALASLLAPSAVFGRQLDAIEVSVYQGGSWSGHLSLRFTNQVTLQLTFTPQPAPADRRAIVRSASLRLAVDDLAILAATLAASADLDL